MIIVKRLLLFALEIVVLGYLLTACADAFNAPKFPGEAPGAAILALIAIASTALLMGKQIAHWIAAPAFAFLNERNTNKNA